MTASTLSGLAVAGGRSRMLQRYPVAGCTVRGKSSPVVQGVESGAVVVFWPLSSPRHLPIAVFQLLDQRGKRRDRVAAWVVHAAGGRRFDDLGYIQNTGRFWVYALCCYMLYSNSWFVPWMRNPRPMRWRIVGASMPDRPSPLFPWGFPRRVSRASPCRGPLRYQAPITGAGLPPIARPGSTVPHGMPVSPRAASSPTILH